MDENALFRLTNGLYVLGANDNGHLVGSLIDAVTQVAHGPNIIIISCGNQSYTKEVIEKTNIFSLSILGKSVDPFVLANFGFQSSRNVNKWDVISPLMKDDLPYYPKSTAIIKAKVISKQQFSSNTMFVAEVLDAECLLCDEALTYADYRNGFKNEVLKSFNEYKSNSHAEKEKKMAEEKKNLKWVCTVCGYVYDEETPFEELPEDWVCPLCGVDKSFFEQKEM